MTPTPRHGRRILIRSGKSPHTAVPIEDALHRNVIATNAGNLIFSDAAHKILSVPGTEVVSNGIWAEHPHVSEINEEFDAFVIPLANAFRLSFERHLIRLTRLIRKLKIPVVVVGVGAQTGLDYRADRLAPIEQSVRDFVGAVLDHSATIGVRGEFTEQYLKGLGFRDVEVIGCPSLFLHGDRLPVTKKTDTLAPDARIAVNGSHAALRNKHLAALLRRTWEEYGSTTFVGQNLSEARQLHWRDLSDPAARGSGRLVPTHPAHPLYQEGRVRVYVDPVTWIRELADADFSFGARIHGNIAALLAGTPATVLCADSRTLELARYFEIPHVRLSDLDPTTDAAELYAAADLGPLVKGHKERYLRFTGFLSANGLENVFEHGDGGAEFDTRMGSIDFPPAIRPWNELGLDAVSDRMAWLGTRLEEATRRADQLERALTKAVAGRPDAGRQQLPLYRRARRAAGRMAGQRGRRALRAVRGLQRRGLRALQRRDAGATGGTKGAPGKGATG